MVRARRFHSNFLFCIPLTQGNAVFFSRQVHNLIPTVPTTLGNGQVAERSKDAAYLAAQYVYAIWMILMMIKAIVGLRANLKFNLRVMGWYNLLFGLDSAFEFVHTTLGVIFQDMSQMDAGAVIRFYCVNYLILLVQLYGFFCCWIHLKWVHIEMAHELIASTPQEPPLELMFPCIKGRLGGRSASETVVDTLEDGAMGTAEGVTPASANPVMSTTSGSFSVISMPEITPLPPVPPAASSEMDTTTESQRSLESLPANRSRASLEGATRGGDGEIQEIAPR
ncbi:hypothetical protein BGZ98_001837 [Dissophora globulifera]|nr:hypothetical protein BGZ98_001837 [Dissophora globulifera]